MADDASTQSGTDGAKGDAGTEQRAHDGKQGDSGKGGSGQSDAHLDSLLGGKGTDRTGTGQQDTKGDDQGKQDDSKSGDLSEGQLKQVADMLAPAMQQYAQQIADRLVNAQGKQLRKGQRDDDQQGKGDDKGQDRQRSDRDDDGPSRADQREADLELRSELRELRPDGAGAEYRSLAEGIGRRYLADNLADGQRPERAARNAAKAATADIESFRKAVQTETVGYLRRKGQIVEGAGKGQGGGSSAAGATGAAAGSEEQAIRRARAMAEEFNQANGHKATTGTATT
ncbi:hypothetical protein [Actinomycetospora termitidis]|uniref:Uncharacterized protein n=1 Tax=Actinomycetospora termitidis TaxID=3053470 RepID=A0ABT7MFG1_9PSEU|nr:hypothetical protein [Actinomycetospora sp. Odt1-22]MDL5159413.1 hypothetical protein [Actinomycetospora sp. Odt1-22]